MKTFRNHRGFSAAELLVATGIMGGLMTALMSLNQIQIGNLRGSQAITTRDQLRSLADRYSRDMGVLLTSSKLGTHDGNVLLRYCLYGEKNPDGSATSRPTGCTSTDGINCCRDNSSATTGFPFVMVDLADPTPDINQKAVFAGADPTPARYTIDGTPCAQASGACPFELASNFYVSCAKGAGTQCEKANGVLQTQYEIRIAPGVKLPGNVKIERYVSQKIPVSRFIHSSGITAPSGGGGSEMPDEPEKGAHALNYKVFTGNGSFKVPHKPPVTTLYVTLIGGGGSGAWDNSLYDETYGSAGTSGCAIVRARVAVKPKEVYTVSAGPGGALAPNTSRYGSTFREFINGINGNPSLFLKSDGTVLLQAEGGHGGTERHNTDGWYNRLNNFVRPPDCLNGGSLAFNLNPNPVLSMTTIPGTPVPATPDGDILQGGAAPVPNIYGVNTYGAGGNGSAIRNTPYSWPRPGTRGVVVIEW